MSRTCPAMQGKKKLPATKGPQQTSLLSGLRVHTRCLHRWEIYAFSFYKGAVLFVEISQSAHKLHLRFDLKG